MTDPSPDPLVNSALTVFGASDVLMILIILLLLIASALFAGAEVAFFTISKTEKDQLKKSDKQTAKIALKLLEKPKELLATILVGKNFLNVAFVVLSSSFIFKLLFLFQLNTILIFSISIVSITLLLLFCGEAFPKMLAFKNKAAYVIHMTRSIYFFKILPPFSWLIRPLSKSSGVLEKRAKRKGIKLSSDTLETVLALTQSTNEPNSILQGVLKFGNTDVKQVMCPRIDVVGVDEKSTLEELMQLVVDAGYSRLPVFRDSFDDVVGIIYAKDLLTHLALGKEFEWKQLIRDPFFVPENKKIDDLLKEFQSKKVHLAIVVDEYGGSCGIITLEDVLEEIVGEITDESDEDVPTYTQIDEKTYLFEGRIALSEFYKILNINGATFEEVKQDAESLGGFIVQTAGRIPKINETMSFGNIQLIVDASDKKHIKKVRAIVN